MRVSLEIHESIEADSQVVALSLRKLANWYERNHMDSQRNPMTGVCTYHDDTVMVKREYRKTDCFAIYKQFPSPTTTGEKS